MHMYVSMRKVVNLNMRDWSHCTEKYLPGTDVYFSNYFSNLSGKDLFQYC